MTRILKLGLISAFVFFLILYLMSLMIPNTVRISRAININAPAASIYPLLENRPAWKSWNEMVTDSIVIRDLRSDSDLIVTEWTYKERSVQSSFRLEESAGVTVVQWYFDFRLKWYPWEKFGSITFDKQFGTPMETSLNNLKKLIENSP